MLFRSDQTIGADRLISRLGDRVVLRSRARKEIGYDDLRRVMDADKIEVTKGDMVCFYTGFGDVILSLGGSPDARTLETSCAVLDLASGEARIVEYSADARTLNAP